MTGVTAAEGQQHNPFLPFNNIRDAKVFLRQLGFHPQQAQLFYCTLLKTFWNQDFPSEKTQIAECQDPITRLECKFIISYATFIGRELRELQSNNKKKFEATLPNILATDIHLANLYLARKANAEFFSLLRKSPESKPLDLAKLSQFISDPKIIVRGKIGNIPLWDNCKQQLNPTFFDVLGEYLRINKVTPEKKLLTIGLFLGVAVGKGQANQSLEQEYIQNLNNQMNIIISSLGYVGENKPSFKINPKYPNESQNPLIPLRNRLNQEYFKLFREGFTLGRGIVLTAAASQELRKYGKINTNERLHLFLQKL